MHIYQPSDLRRLLKRLPKYYPGWWSSGGGADPAGWPLSYWSYGYHEGPTSLTANTLILQGFILPVKLTFSKLICHIWTADGVNNSDFGLYDSAGNLIANIGAQHIGANQFQTIASVQGAKTIKSGQYFFAVTSAAAVLAVGTGAKTANPYYSASFGSSAGGALPATITPPALATVEGSINFGFST